FLVEVCDDQDGTAGFLSELLERCHYHSDVVVLIRIEATVHKGRNGVNDDEPRASAYHKVVEVLHVRRQREQTLGFILIYDVHDLDSSDVSICRDQTWKNRILRRILTGDDRSCADDGPPSCGQE